MAYKSTQVTPSDALSKTLEDDASKGEISTGRISKGRRSLLNIMLIGLSIASAYEIAVRGEHWPFSSYPMFSKTRTEGRVLHHALLAIPKDGSEAFPLYESKYIYPFLWYRQRAALRRMLNGPGGTEAVKKGLEDTLARYEYNRQKGRHDGPELRSLQLYEIDWAVVPDAPDFIQSEKRDFIAEVQSQ